ncbi:MAG: rane metalloprotease, partial [Hyphomicrobiales bacterium]|nr:rane metalloprotease [Hyphomicrobiales bacterium]
GLVAALLFRIGWMKPLAIVHEKLRWGRGGLVVLVVASLAVLVALVVLLNPLRVLVTGNLTGTGSLTALGVIQEIQRQAVWYVLVNMLPIPGLTGALLLQAVAPGLKPFIERYQLGFAVALLVLAAFGVFQMLLGPLNELIAGQLIVLIS